MNKDKLKNLIEDIENLLAKYELDLLDLEQILKDI